MTLSGSQARGATLISCLLHTAAVVLLLSASGRRQAPVAIVRQILVMPRDIVRLLPKAAREHDGGGGGGVRADGPASLGRLPRPALRQFVPPAVETVNAHPLLAIEPTIVAPADLVLPHVDMARYGIPGGAAGPPSGGRGSGGGIGDGDGTGVGPGTGSGLGPGRGGGVRAEGARGAVTAPAVLWMIEPEYSEEARKAKVQGVVILAIEIDERGRVGRVQVRQGLGLGLDERAAETVRRWKFKPGARDGKAVPTTAVVCVNFRLL